jgi:hypothetical protein
MMRLLGLSLAVLGGAQAGTPTPQKKRHAEAPVIRTGNQLYDLCQTYKTDKLDSPGFGCFMYISGATQTLLLNDDSETTMLSPCPGGGVTDQQIADVVVKWMDDHPEKRDRPAPWIIMRALNDAFPCN